MLLSAIREGLGDAFANRQRNAELRDYSPDPAATGYPAWESPAPAGPPQTLSGLVEDWWREAQTRESAISTYESYRNTMKRLIAFLGHDDARRVTPADVVRFKDHRLSEINPQTGKSISPKTVKDSDLVGLKSVFGWAVANLRIDANPALGVTLKRGRPTRSRSKGFSQEEAERILAHAWRVKQSSVKPKTLAAKRWAPWLCAYTGARIGEIVQLRKEDVRRQGRDWVITITPDAGPVKTRQVREVPLHPHLIELGFGKFVESSADGYLFIDSSPKGMRGPWQGVKNRISEFVREVMPDKRVSPNHAWRHRFKTVGREKNIQERVLGAITGHAPRDVGESYGDVSLSAMKKAIARMPRYAVLEARDEEQGQ